VYAAVNGRIVHIWTVSVHRSLAGSSLWSVFVVHSCAAAVLRLYPGGRPCTSARTPLAALGVCLRSAFTRVSSARPFLLHRRCSRCRRRRPLLHMRPPPSPPPPPRLLTRLRTSPSPPSRPPAVKVLTADSARCCVRVRVCAAVCHWGHSSAQLTFGSSVYRRAYARTSCPEADEADKVERRIRTHPAPHSTRLGSHPAPRTNPKPAKPFPRASSPNPQPHTPTCRCSRPCASS
jgi:hypothetical protein